MDAPNPATRQPYLPAIAEVAESPSGQPGKLLQRWWRVLKITVAGWRKDQATQLAAAIAYYTLFSIAPLLLVVIAVAGAVLGDTAVIGHLEEELRDFMGKEGAAVVQQMVAQARQQGGGATASIISIALLLYGASKVFNQLKVGLNRIWEIEPRKNDALTGAVKYYLLSFGMVISVGFVLLVSLVVHSVLAGMKSWLSGSVPGVLTFAYFGEILGSILVTALLFALILRYLPDTQVPWRNVWIGAFITAVLFVIGKFLFGLYLSRGTVKSTYGAAGSVIVVLLWAYYSALIFLFGAEFTKAHARVFGKKDEAESAEQETT